MEELRESPRNIHANLSLLRSKSTSISDFCHFPDKTLKFAIGLTLMTRLVVGKIAGPESMRLVVKDSPVGRKLSLVYFEDGMPILGCTFDSLAGDLVVRSTHQPHPECCYRIEGKLLMSVAANALALRVCAHRGLYAFNKSRDELGVIYDELFSAKLEAAPCPDTFMGV